LYQKTIEERKSIADGELFEQRVADASEAMRELSNWATSVDLDALALPENLNQSLILCQVTYSY
jgi:hypothetical protein